MSAHEPEPSFTATAAAVRPSRQRRPGLAHALVCLAALWSTACGVGGEGTGGPNAVVAEGRVEGFGSVIVAGQRFDDSSAELAIEIEPTRALARPLSDLRLGMSVQVLGRGFEPGLGDATPALPAMVGKAQQLLVRPELVGPVQAVAAASGRVLVAGTWVQTDTLADATAFDGLRALTELDEGDWLEVHGQHDAAAHPAAPLLRATRIARSVPEAGIRLTGLVAAVNAAEETFQLGALTVRYAAAARLPAGAAPRVGESLVAFGTALDATGRLPATVLQSPRLLATGGPEGSDAHLRGRIERVLAPGRVVVRGAQVDATNGDAATRAALQPGRLLVASGVLRGGVLLAQRVQLPAEDRALQAEISAAVADFVDARSFKMRGAAVSAASAGFDALTPANIANGVPLQVRGRLGPNGILAETVRAAGVPAGSVIVQAGTVNRYDRDGRSFRLEGLATAFRLAGNVATLGGTLANLADGVVVQVRGVPGVAGAEFAVQVIEFAGAAAVIELAGIAGHVEADAVGGGGAFEIGPDDMVWTATTRFIGTTNTAADLADGRVIRVRVVREGPAGAPLRALDIDTRASLPGVVRLRGTVSAYVSAGDFRVDGQRVDASGAAFEPPELARTLAGAYVDIEGTMEAGVLRATRVSDP